MQRRDRGLDDQVVMLTLRPAPDNEADGAGRFAVDEDPAKLGETVVLPPFLEPQRKQIVGNLKPID